MGGDLGGEGGEEDYPVSTRLLQEPEVLLLVPLYEDAAAVDEAEGGGAGREVRD